MKLATLCYIRRDEKTLMLCSAKENHFKKNIWNGLGGKFEKNETPEECVVREVFEESGLVIKNPKLSGFITFPDQDGEDWYVFVFTVHEFEGITTESHEGKLEWVEDNKLMDLNVSEGDKIFMPWIYENKFFSAKFVYKNGKLDSHEVVFYS